MEDVTFTGKKKMCEERAAALLLEALQADDKLGQAASDDDRHSDIDMV